MQKLYRALFFILLTVIIIFSAWPILHGNIDFHTDIARDFLLLDDVYYNKNITLIGPRSGGIPGVFHGPLWLYVNLPAYVLGGGNPVAVGWFWILLFVVSVGVVYEVARRMFDEKAAMIASLVYSSAYGSSVYAFFNPSGAVLLFPVFFYLLWLFIKKDNPLVLAAAMFILGCIIQFQMAFGVPMLILITPYILFRTIIKKKWINLLMMLVIVVPTSSYILFELRHDFLQIRSVFGYLNGAENAGKVYMPFRELLYQRINFLMNDSLGMITYDILWITFFVGFSLVFTLIKEVKKINLSDKYLLFVYLLGGFWALTLAYKGVIWGYYYIPFVGIVAIFFASTYKYFNKKVFAVLLAVLLLNNMQVLYWKTVDQDFTQGNWLFFKDAALRVFNDAPSEFGYYIYTTDQYGYSSRYAMNYLDRLNPDKSAYPYQKKPVTYLMIDDPGDHEFTNHMTWKTYDVRIATEPARIETVSKTYKIERYNLTDEQLAVESNPFMLNSIIFR
ncbi:glycosyltransferase family 39 protein [Candidatus Roizmanbacteria bacterium]|nr:MAG: glycosyltransferase family 39 protein [Candidatus Roizmanbacteria bacterium]